MCEGNGCSFLSLPKALNKYPQTFNFLVDQGKD